MNSLLNFTLSLEIINKKYYPKIYTKVIGHIRPIPKLKKPKNSANQNFLNAEHSNTMIMLVQQYNVTLENLSCVSSYTRAWICSNYFTSIIWNKQYKIWQGHYCQPCAYSVYYYQTITHFQKEDNWTVLNQYKIIMNINWQSHGLINISFKKNKSVTSWRR